MRWRRGGGSGGVVILCDCSSSDTQQWRGRRHFRERKLGRERDRGFLDVFFKKENKGDKSEAKERHVRDTWVAWLINMVCDWTNGGGKINAK